MSRYHEIGIMIVDKLIRELDDHIERLQTARNTIASLTQAGPAATPKRSRAVETPAPAPAVVEATEAAGIVSQVESAAEPRRRGRPRGSRNAEYTPRPRRRVEEPRALASKVPAGPVVVSARDVASRKPEPPHTVEEPKPAALVSGGLEELIREAASRTHAHILTTPAN